MLYKSSFVLMLSLFILVVSCTKSSHNVQPKINSKVLPGVWEYRYRMGGMMPQHPDEFKTGNGNRWAFSATQFQEILGDTVYQNGTYSVSQGMGTDLNSRRTVDQFIFNNVPSESFELRDDTLRFYSGAIMWDGDIMMYVKISDDTTGN